jgi:hypothetical protein
VPRPRGLPIVDSLRLSLDRFPLSSFFLFIRLFPDRMLLLNHIGRTSELRCFLAIVLSLFAAQRQVSAADSLL